LDTGAVVRVRGIAPPLIGVPTVGPTAEFGHVGLRKSGRAAVIHSLASHPDGGSALSCVSSHGGEFEVLVRLPGLVVRA